MDFLMIIPKPSNDLSFIVNERQEVPYILLKCGTQVVSRISKYQVIFHKLRILFIGFRSLQISFMFQKNMIYFYINYIKGSFVWYSLSRGRTSPDSTSPDPMMWVKRMFIKQTQCCDKAPLCYYSWESLLTWTACQYSNFKGAKEV